ncbi:9361_t:CDS:2 [Entrophospora sp. SA101]|nr:1031_t:CDS:2 [Entrophospora sp. SA101]CAJ0645769.1 4209_t:CDS:2 [Entrophospora sp. SA101]CAJ0759461.1 3873_t:CDS:2 [Entrophospora sp. SA101]CAJ0767043.1 9361_t:CDS:2 [Entrophospora sp. SA101]CAJ0838498.1 4301_t:CDS:2 [Entrophospora sp. SA101]
MANWSSEFLTNDVKSAIGLIGGLTNMNIEIGIPDFVKKIFSKNPTQSTSSNLLKVDSDRSRFIKKEDEDEKDSDENDAKDFGVYKKRRGFPVQNDEFMLLTKNR